MKNKQGRKSAAELGVTVIGGGIPERPKAPSGLSSAQMDVWNEVVRTEPAGFFNTAALKGLLTSYCRHREASDLLSVEVDAFDVDWLKDDAGARKYDLLLRMREREAKSATSLATKLRLTNQARYTPKAAGTSTRNQPRVAKPWES